MFSSKFLLTLPCEVAPAPYHIIAAMLESTLYGRVLGLANLGMLVLDTQLRVVLWNQWLASRSGMAANRVLGMELLALFPELGGHRLEQAIHGALSNNLPALLPQAQHRAPLPLYAAGTWGGERIEQTISVTPFSEGKERFCLVEVTDVSGTVGRERQLRGQAEALRAQSYVDGLTGIANRRHFDVALDRELRRAHRHEGQLSLLLMDIDSFKAYNDHFGHQQGDACLTMVAEAFAAMLQRPGDLAARYGGEEFAAVLPDTSLEQACAHAERIRSHVAGLAMAHAPDAVHPHVTLSIGVASFQRERLHNAKSLLEAADRALYAAKHAGRNRVMVDGAAALA
jgi:diguanylate cyclase (GGDEF)-like protein